MQCENKMLDKSLRCGSFTAAKARNGIWIGSAALQDYSSTITHYTGSPSFSTAFCKFIHNRGT